MSYTPLLIYFYAPIVPVWLVGDLWAGSCVPLTHAHCLHTSLLYSTTRFSKFIFFLFPAPELKTFLNTILVAILVQNGV
jgi:hypothetical protein